MRSRLDLKPLALGFAALIAIACICKAKPLSSDNGQRKPNLPATNARLLGVNLIKNGDAENIDSKAWSPADNLKTLAYGEFGGGPAADSLGPANRGQRYFYAKVTSDKPSVVFSQSINLDGLAEDVDKGGVQFALEGWFGGVNTSFSSTRITANFLDAGGKQLQTVTTAEVKPEERADDLVLIARAVAGGVPGGTRKVEVKLEFYILKGHEGENIDTNAYADNLSLVLTQKP